MDYDFAIIGGGIAGVSLAARLSGAGRVLVLEAEANLAHHASGRSAALYEPRYGLPPIVELSLASGRYFHETPNILSPRGLMIVAKAEDRAAFDEDCAGMDLAEIGIDAGLAMVPILNPETVASVGFADHAWDIDTDLLIQGFARQARSQNATFQMRAKVLGLDRDGAGWRVRTTTGDMTARVVVNAAGAWADEVAGLAGVAHIGLTPLRRSMARLPAPNGLDVSRWPMIFGAGESWYAKPDAGALIVSPAEEDLTTPHDAFADDMVLAEGLARYEEMVTAPVTRLLANWAGLRSFAPDRVPVIGFDAAVPGFFWLAGQGGYGFQSCPAASQLAADLILGNSPDADKALIGALSPQRFA
jgi:D-arginine dehydrogenase